MERKWLVAGVVGVLALVAVLALVVGGVVGRSIVPDARRAAARPATERFADTLTDVAISYPATWVRRSSRDQAVRILASSPDSSAAVSVSVRKSGIEEPVTQQNLPVVRTLTDDLLQGRHPDHRDQPIRWPVTVGGLPGYRYRYTYRTADKTEGAHVHYFLFKDDRLVQLVLQAVPATRAAGAAADVRPDRRHVRGQPPLNGPRRRRRRSSRAVHRADAFLTRCRPRFPGGRNRSSRKEATSNGDRDPRRDVPDGRRRRRDQQDRRPLLREAVGGPRAAAVLRRHRPRAAQAPPAPVSDLRARRRHARLRGPRARRLAREPEDHRRGVHQGAVVPAGDARGARRRPAR